MKTKIKDIMEKAVVIDQHATFVDALREMVLKKTNSLLVVDESGRLTAKIQVFDLINQVVPAYVMNDEIAAHFVTDEIFKEACQAAKDIPVEKFMNKNPKTISLQGSLLEAMVIAMSHGQARIPVVDEQHRPQGILTRTQLKQVIGKCLDVEKSPVEKKPAEAKPLKTTATEPLTSFLLPVDGGESSKRAVKFSGCLAAALGDRIKTITLLRVLTGGYLERRLDKMAKRHVRDEIIETKLFNTYREEHISQNIMPMLEETKKELSGFSTRAAVDHQIVDGVPTEEILKIAEERKHSTIVMGRRGISAVREILLGSVTTSLLHKAVHQSVYVVGAKSEILKADVCPIPRIIVPLDGSSHSLAAAREASIIAKCYGNAIAEIVLLHVINLARYSKGDYTKKSPEEVINQAQEIFIGGGVDKSRISTVAEYGNPGKIILDTIEEKQSNLVIMGRRGRSAFQEHFMGSISRQVVHRCTDATVGIICRD